MEEEKQQEPVQEKPKVKKPVPVQEKPKETYKPFTCNIPSRVGVR